MSDRPPPSNAARAASRVIASFYADHVTNHGGKSCRCEKTAPDRTCDVGEALFRVQARELMRFDDPRKAGP